MKTSRNDKRVLKKARIRKKVNGTAERPRLAIYKSLKHIYAQIVDDSIGHTLVAASTLSEAFEGDATCNKEAARKVGKLIAKRALEKNITSVSFDRSGYIFHGRVKELADGAREQGLIF